MPSLRTFTALISTLTLFACSSAQPDRLGIGNIRQLEPSGGDAQYVTVWLEWSLLDPLPETSQEPLYGPVYPDGPLPAKEPDRTALPAPAPSPVREKPTKPWIPFSTGN